MRFGNFILGVALLLVAGTLAVTITFRNAPEPGKSSAEAGSRSETPRAARSASRERSLAWDAPSGPRRSAGSSRREIPKVEEMDLNIDEGASAPALTPARRQDLAARAPGVKRAALAKLDRMTERFDLSRDQRSKIFPLLVESTTGYDPAMVVTVQRGGVAVPVAVAIAEAEGDAVAAVTDSGEIASRSPDEEIHDVLDPDQQEEFVEDKMDEIAWWNEIAGQLEDEFDSAVAAGNAPPVEETPDPEAEAGDAESDFRQGGNIFDLLDQ